MFSHDQEFTMQDDNYDRRESSRVRRVKPTRRRTHRSKSPTAKSGAPGGIRQRRNKHWNW